MLVIKETQLDAFKIVAREKFIQKSLIFLKENFYSWSREQSEDDLVEFINKMIDFGAKMGIHKEINVQKLMVFHLRHPELNLREELLKEEYVPIHNFKEEEQKITALHNEIIQLELNNDNS